MTEADEWANFFLLAFLIAHADTRSGIDIEEYKHCRYGSSGDSDNDNAAITRMCG